MTDEQEEGRIKLGAAVVAARVRRYGTVDAARIEARVSRGSWEKVEKGIKVRDYTLAAVEKALSWPAGTAQGFLDGSTPDSSIAMPPDFRDWLVSTDTLSESQRREILERYDQWGESVRDFAQTMHREEVRAAVQEAKGADAPQSSREPQSGAGA